MWYIETKDYIITEKGIIYKRRKKKMFDTYIDDKDMIPVLLDHDWVILKNTWTDCPYPTYRALHKTYRHNGNAVPFLEGEMS